jgi:hypothetical protein
MTAAGVPKSMKRAKFRHAISTSAPPGSRSLDTDGALKQNTWNLSGKLSRTCFGNIPHKTSSKYLSCVSGRHLLQAAACPLTTALSGRLSCEITRILPPSRRTCRALEECVYQNEAKAMLVPLHDKGGIRAPTPSCAQDPTTLRDPL